MVEVTTLVLVILVLGMFLAIGSCFWRYRIRARVLERHVVAARAAHHTALEHLSTHAARMLRHAE